MTDERGAADPAKVLKTALFLQRLGSHGPAIEHLSEVLIAEPYNVKALRALLLSRRAVGEDEHAQALLERLEAIIPDDTNPPKVRVLALTTAEGLPTPLLRALGRHDIRILALQIDTLSANARLPDHDIFVGLLAFEARYRPLLLHLEEVISRAALPAVNRPAALLGSDPSILPWRLAPLEGLTVARTFHLDRELLESPDFVVTLASLRLQFPLLIRPLDERGARREHVRSAERLEVYLATARARRFECAQFLDLRCADGRVRCYRMALIDQASFPLAFASAFHWCVDLNADDAWPQSLEEEERRFFADPAASCGAHVLRQLQAIANCLEIDACTIDFSLNDDAALTVLAVDASCDWPAAPEGDRASAAMLSLLFERVSSVSSGSS